MKLCENTCGTELGYRQKRFCGVQCSGEWHSKIQLQRWLDGEISGLTVHGVVTRPVKQWLRDNQGNCCSICGWAEVNPYTGLVPVVADHIDGNWQNNRPDNLRLVCPNCDSLSPTYKGANRGNGRSFR